jgi:acyl dehydratase
VTTASGLASRTIADFPVGKRVRTRNRTITEADIVNFAGLTWDFYPLHTDEEYARTTRFGRRIAHGPLVYCYSIGLMPIDFFGDAIVAYLGVEGLRHQLPVYIGDTLHVDAEVIESRPTSGGDTNLVKFAYATKNQHDEVVMEMTALFLIGHKASGK